MFIDRTHNARINSVRRSGIQLEFDHSESFRSSERSRMCASSTINMSPLTGVKPVICKRRGCAALKKGREGLSSMKISPTVCLELSLHVRVLVLT